ncbi:class I adenylate-forming enzyme family protein [Actinomadura mexicana]|uniref:OPC-8:0 CoA ligase-1 n=1 Tax=Actinomadura mexicana TaxID=134959 RepID=A0A239EE00_9ACTN|nr:AMP-binding protein [Actinomadura mexicana]SNS42233.1 OPC-8:0 CoA ligase-1 [Actinomadura mexicana]
MDHAYPAVTVTRAVLGTAPDPGKTAVLDASSGRSLSHAELSALVGTVASALARAGSMPGDVIGLRLREPLDLAVALHAVIAAGAVPFPRTGPDTSRLLEETGARSAITDDPRGDGGPHTGEATLLRLTDLLAAPAPADPRTAGARTCGDVALLACTRGTGRGPARTVRLTHAEVVAGLMRVAESAMFGGGDTVLSALPFSTVLGLNGVLNPALRLGATVVAFSGAGRHDLLRALRDHRVTVAVLPPELLEALAYERAVCRYDLRALRAVVVAGGPLAAEEARAAAARLGCPVRQAYGLAEAGGFTHLNLRAAEEGTLDSVGRGLPGVAWRVVDPRTGAVQPAYQPGEMCVRLPVARAAAGPARWLPTGDSAFADEHGRVFILGRLAGAHREPPGDPEAVLAAHPSVGDAVVAPAPDDDLGLAPHAFAVLAEPVSEADLLAHVNGRVPRTREVSAVHVVDEIPRTPDGRVRRRELLERAGLSP